MLIPYWSPLPLVRIQNIYEIVDMAQNILDDGEEGFIKHIRTLERYRKKAKNVMKMVQMLVDGYQGAILNSSAAL